MKKKAYFPTGAMVCAAAAALVLTAAGAACGQSMAFSTDVMDTRDPRVFLDDILSKKDSLPEEDKAALRKMLAEQLADETALVPYEAMSPGRRIRLNSLLSGMVGQFQDDPIYMTPLQREYNRRQFAPALKAFFNVPVFAPTDSPEVRSQVETMAKTLAAAAEKKYPEIVGTKAAATARQKMIEDFLRRAGYDNAPSLKYPLPPGDFARVLQEIEAAYAALQPRRQPAGPSEDFWNSLSDEQRQQRLEMQARQTAFWLGVEFRQVSRAYESASVKAAMEGPYSVLDLARLQERRQNLTDPQERKELNDLAQRAGQEMWELQRAYTAREQERWRKEAEKNRFQAYFGDPMESDKERIVADLAPEALEAAEAAETAVAIEPEPVAAEPEPPAPLPTDVADEGDEEPSRAKGWVSVAALLCLGGAGVLLAIMRRRKTA